MIKQEVRKNRQRIRNLLKKKLNSVSTESSDSPLQKLKNKIPHLKCNKIHKKTSEQIRNYDQLMFLKQTHSQHTFQSMFELLEKIGQGCHSVVYKCRQIQTGKIFAAKLFKSADIDALRQYKEHFMIKKAVRHQNIIRAYNLFINEKLKTIHMICQYCPFQNLRYFMKTHQNIDEATIQSIMFNILKGVHILHRHGICHRDLKPQNILYNPKTNELKLIDFQIAKMNKYENLPLEMWTNTGTLYYKAPQMFKNSYNEVIDMWAVGVIAYELTFKKLPFKSEYVSETIESICEKQPDYDKDGVSSFLIQFIKNCLMKDPCKRIKCYEALKSPFLLNFQSQLCPNSQTKKIAIKNFEQDCDCGCEKENFHLQINKISPTARRSHSSNQALNKKYTFQNDNGIRFLDN